jgi:hypothetical protein
VTKLRILWTAVVPRDTAIFRASASIVPRSTIALDGGWIEREDDQGKLAIVRQKLAADDLIAHHATEQGIVSGAFRQPIWKQRRRNRTVFRRLTRREN